MADITAAAVKSLRERTGLPMMECKKALVASGGDENAAIEELRKAGIKTQSTRSGRETSEGRISIYSSFDPPIGAMVELLCESAPVTKNDDFVQLSNDLAQQLATGPGAATAEELLSQPSPSKKGMTLAEQKDDLFNRIREVFNVNRIVRFDGASAGYVHHNGKNGVMIEANGGNAELARDIAMHVAAMKPTAVNRDDLDPEVVAKERDILTEASRKEGKPENIIEKMVEGRMRNFYAEKVLIDQAFVKDDKSTVGKVAEGASMKLIRFVHWEVGK